MEDGQNRFMDKTINRMNHKERINRTIDRTISKTISKTIIRGRLRLEGNLPLCGITV